MPIAHVNNKAIAGYLLWRDLDPTETNVEDAYACLRKLFDLKDRELQKKRIAGVQSAMCNEPFQQMIMVLKLTNALEHPTPGGSPSGSCVQPSPGAPGLLSPPD